MSDSGDEGDSDKMAGPSSAPVEALSVGRARRATAGNRMRELLEQERERIAAEGEDPSLSTSRAGHGASFDDDDDDQSKEKKKKKKKGGKSREDEDENAIFQNDDNDIDFEELEGGEDIVDSDFDLSSDQGEGDDEEAGERALQAEEKAAKKASKSKTKTIPTQAKRTALPPKSALIRDEDEAESATGTAKQKKRISFASSAANDASGDNRNQRSSKRKSAIQFSESVQARLKEDEERRARQLEHAQPKRKKVRLSQADLIAEALEMEEQNRQSLKVFLEGEEERRERDRKRGKKKMEGSFMRWRSVTIEYDDADHTAHAKNRPHAKIEEIESSSTSVNVTEDPAIAARQAAIKERNARQAAEGDAVTNAAAERDREEGNKTEKQAMGPVTNAEKVENAEEFMIIDASTQSQKDGVSSIDLDEGKVSEQIITESRADETVSDNAATVPSTLVVADPKMVASTTDEKDITLQSGQENKEVDPVPRKTEKEARTFISLHELPSSTHWTTMFSHILGDHMDWSRYPYVNPRNRPLRPRISVCPITGLPAKYRDPRSGIPFANREAFANLTAVIKGEFRWSVNHHQSDQLSEDTNKQSNSTSKTASKKVDQSKKFPRYDPMEMGCFLDRMSEPGANNVRLKAEEGLSSVDGGKRFGSLAGNVRIAADYVPFNALAPGDEQAVVAAASALPAGSTRSGGRRSAASTRN